MFAERGGLFTPRSRFIKLPGNLGSDTLQRHWDAIDVFDPTSNAKVAITENAPPVKAYNGRVGGVLEKSFVSLAKRAHM